MNLMCNEITREFAKSKWKIIRYYLNVTGKLFVVSNEFYVYILSVWHAVNY